MKYFFKPKPLFITFAMYVVALAAAGAIVYFEKENWKPVLAGAGDNLSGFAWSSNVGWISFNSTDCDTDANGYVDAGACGGDNATTPTYDYGVNIDAGSGDFSGYAWSSNVGWIHFAPAAGFPGTPNTGVHYDSVSGNVTGWAKILTLGDDGWLKMSDDGVAVWNGKGVKIDGATGKLSGRAWNGNDNGAGIGWLSFNSDDCDTDGNGYVDSGACGGDNTTTAAHSYAVSRGGANTAPTAINLTAPNWSMSQACSLYARQAFLRWEFSDPDAGASQSAYEVEVDDSSNFASPVVDTGKTSGSANQVMLDQSDLSYNTPYYWRVKVWDEYDAASAWVEYDSLTDTDNNDANNLTFTAYKHEMPDVSFSWFPASPSRGEEVQFTDASQIYLTADPATPALCDEANCDWLWTAADATIDSPTASSTVIKFNNDGSQSVTLTVTDSDGYYCSKTENISVGSELPEWKEIKAR